jgi:hypothetical protein
VVSADGGDGPALIFGLQKFATLGEPDKVEHPDADNASTVRATWTLASAPIWARYLARYNPDPDKGFIALTIVRHFAGPASK